MMTNDQLQQIKARCDAATRGPWKYHTDIGKKYYIHSPTYGVRDFCCLTSGFEREADAVFVTEARQDIPDLLQEVERLRAEVERFRAKRNETIDAIENLMESCRACDMCALNESDDTCSDNGEGYCSPVWIGRKEG